MKGRFPRFAVAALAFGAVGACGSGTESAAPSTSRSADQVTGCPTAAPPQDAEPALRLEGVTGRASVVPPTDRTAPRVTVEGPYRVDKTSATTTREGTGATLTDASVATVCYQGVNGRTGEVFDDAFARGESVEFSLADVVTGFRKALSGQKVGATVIAAVTAADGYPNGQPAAGIKEGDSLIFTITVLAAS
ncbi:FKBP-type peptidyl-prolyl cis-trans isomerase [Tsukamurella sp. 1534]|uniref:FKBP-type peptidyl-prolyl cis-trans isomerase n=1 Tax=Tsukamurella sp. 1534 TaxID=1151061 RepID=UPI0002D7BE68|nr:FKBP-type peptidyl-prolyl cis-trans isomerase [Tsukamurella sp. 1534]